MPDRCCASRTHCPSFVIVLSITETEGAVRNGRSVEHSIVPIPCLCSSTARSSQPVTTMASLPDATTAQMVGQDTACLGKHREACTPASMYGYHKHQRLMLNQAILVLMRTTGATQRVGMKEFNQMKQDTQKGLLQANGGFRAAAQEFELVLRPKEPWPLLQRYWKHK